MHVQDLFQGQPPWGFEHELLSAGSAASSGADGCVPELTQRGLSHVIIKSEACVPDCSTGDDGSPCMPPIQVQHTLPGAGNQLALILTCMQETSIRTVLFSALRGPCTFMPMSTWSPCVSRREHDTLSWCIQSLDLCTQQSDDALELLYVDYCR